MLRNLVPYIGDDKVIAGDGSKLGISCIGDLSGYGNIKLKDVLVVPQIKKNLLFVSQLARDNACTCEFSDLGFVIKDRQTGKTLATGRKQGTLDKDAVAALVAVRSGKAPEEIWHQRFGHPNSKLLRILSSRKIIDVSKWSKCPTIFSSCQSEKSCRLPFNLSNRLANTPLHQIHCDLWVLPPVALF